MGDKREQGIPMLEHLAERGFVCVTANYALSPKARWPRHVLDCKLALAWVKKHIAEYGGDPSLVFVSGGSAGGHLAALVALTANDPAWQPGFEDEDTTVAACIPLYGVYDFVDPEKIGNANLTPILERRVFEQGAAEAFAAASPISRVSESAPPFLVVHGRNDVLVPVQSARAFVAALRARSTQPVSYAELPLHPARLRQLLVAEDRALCACPRVLHCRDCRDPDRATGGRKVGPLAVSAYHATGGERRKSRPARTDDEPGPGSPGGVTPTRLARDRLYGGGLPGRQGGKPPGLRTRQAGAS